MKRELAQIDRPSPGSAADAADQAGRGARLEVDRRQAAAAEARRHPGRSRLQVVSAHPGATASEVASSMGIKPNYVYRVMAELEKDGRVRKDGKGYHATADSGAADSGSGDSQG